MTNKINSKISVRHLSAVVLVATAVAIPALSFAATFAFVNQNGDVATVNADNANAAMAIAPNIDEHSGVMLLTNPADSVVGDHVPGV